MTVHIDTDPLPAALAGLRFEPLAQAHAKLVLALFNDPDFVRFVGDRGLRSERDAIEWIAGPLADQQRQGVTKYALIHSASGEGIGLCGLMQRSYLPAPDLGYGLLPAWRGRGIAQAAAEHLLAQCDFAHLYAVINADNQPSMALIRRLGFCALDRHNFSLPFDNARVFEWWRSDEKGDKCGDAPPTPA